MYISRELVSTERKRESLRKKREGERRWGERAREKNVRKQGFRFSICGITFDLWTNKFESRSDIYSFALQDFVKFFGINIKLYTHIYRYIINNTKVYIYVYYRNTCTFYI